MSAHINVRKRLTLTSFKSAIVHPPASKLPMLWLAAGGTSEFSRGSWGSAVGR